MESCSEQCVAIKCCFKPGKTATETVEMVRAANGDETLTGSDIFRWYEQLREGREEIQDDPSNGRPSESRTEGNMERVLQVLLQNRHLSLRMRVDESAICKDTVGKTVVEGLKKRKVCFRFVPRALIAEQQDTDLLHVKI
jgi:hypothetical protein